MRVAVIIENVEGRQVCGITSDEALRLAKQGEFRTSFGEYTLRVIVDENAVPLPPARTPPLEWPSSNNLIGD